MDTKAVGEHDEFPGLRRERNRNKTQHQLHWAKSHQTIVTHLDPSACNMN
jgi:hypothetical protein